MTQIAILWHMHQPYYEDLATGEHVLPWVRMHGLKDYYGMVALMREFPQVKLTFNLVPSLLVQLEAFAEDRARDWHLELGLKPAAELTETERATILSEFFHAPRGRMIDRYPRYADLLQKRDSRGGYTDQDFLDLQVWHKLAWVDPFYLDTDQAYRPAPSEAAQLFRRRQARAARGRAGNSAPRHSRIPRGRGAGAGGALDVAVLPPDSSAVVRHRYLPGNPPVLARAAAAVPPS